MVIKTSLAPPPPERPDNRAQRYLRALEHVLLTQHDEFKDDRQADWNCLIQLWQSLVPDEPAMAQARSSSPRSSSSTSQARSALLSLEGVILAKVYQRQSDGDADLDCLVQLWYSLVLEDDLAPSSQPNSSDTKQTPKPPSPGMTALWRQVIDEISVDSSLLGLVLEHQTCLVEIRQTEVQVLVKTGWLRNVRSDSVLIEQVIQSVLGRTDLQLKLKRVASLPGETEPPA